MSLSLFSFFFFFFFSQTEENTKKNTKTKVSKRKVPFEGKLSGVYLVLWVRQCSSSQHVMVLSLLFLSHDPIEPEPRTNADVSVFSFSTADVSFFLRK